jgi:hypothetical protein
VQALRPQPLDTAALPEAIGEVGRRLVRGSTECAPELITTGPTAAAAARDRGHPLAYGTGGARQRGPATQGASRVALTLSYMEDLVTLDVRDDGTGFDSVGAPRAGFEGGYGLSAMRDG